MPSSGSCIHGLVRMCQPRTRRKIQKGFKPAQTSKKRNADGMFAKLKCFADGRDLISVD
jgi:hypothetical protein